jgi:maltooligosyltrehalose trehalohydrolase
MLDWYRTLLALRRSRPELTDPRLDQVHVSFDEEARWLVVHRGPLRIAANLGDTDARVPLGAGKNPAKPVTLLTSDPGISVTPDAITLPAAAFAVIDLASA